MIFHLDKTAVYFKQSFDTKYFEGDLFGRLCKYLEKFPLKNEYPDIAGLCLSGDRYFKNILFSDVPEIPQSEINQITSITPIMKYGPMPYELERNYLEITISVGKKSFEELKDSITQVNQFCDDFFGEENKKVIEVHLKGFCGNTSTESVIKEVVPNYKTGNYLFQTNKKDEVHNGEVTLPVEFSNLPDQIAQLIHFNNDRYSLILEEKENRSNRFVLKHVVLQELEASLYSNNLSDFVTMLKSFNERNLFFIALESEKNCEIPVIAATG